MIVYAVPKIYLFSGFMKSSVLPKIGVFLVVTNSALPRIDVFIVVSVTTV